MASLAKTNDGPALGPRSATLRVSASKARVVLNLIRGKRVADAPEILRCSPSAVAADHRKCCDSAVANAEHNDDIPADELFMSACYADEGPTLKRFRPRARGRASRIHKRTCHITMSWPATTAESSSARASGRGAGAGSAQASAAVADGWPAAGRRGPSEQRRRVGRSRRGEAEDEVDDVDCDRDATRSRPTRPPSDEDG